jgi:hypothetical protein
VACPACGAVYEADDEAAELPLCPACGVTDSWAARQGAAFRQLVAEIDGCRSLAELGAVGKRLYALGLPRDQAGVACVNGRPRRATRGRPYEASAAT